MALRIALLSAHYRTDRSWSDELLERSQVRLAHWRTALASPYGGDSAALIREIITALSDDLNTPQAFRAIDRWADTRIAALKDSEITSDNVGEIGQVARFLDASLGIAL